MPAEKEALQGATFMCYNQYRSKQPEGAVIMTKTKKTDAKTLAVRIVCFALAGLMVFSVIISFLPVY